MSRFQCPASTRASLRHRGEGHVPRSRARDNADDQVVTIVRSSAKTISPRIVLARDRDPLVGGAGGGRRDLMREHEGADVRACGGLRGLDDRRVVVDRVEEPLQTGPCARSRRGARSGRRRRRRGTGRRAPRTARCRRRSQRQHRRVRPGSRRWARRDDDRSRRRRRARRPPRGRRPASTSTTSTWGSQVRSAWCASRYSTSGRSIASIASTTSSVRGGPYTRNGRGLEAHDPVRRDDVVQVVDVVAVQVRQQHGIQHARHRVRGREPHDHAATGIEQQVLPAGAHERGRAGARGVGNRVARAEQDDVDSGVPTRYASRNATGRSAPQWAGAS